MRRSSCKLMYSHIFLLFFLLQAAQIDQYREVYLKKTISISECVASVTQELITPHITFCVQECLSSGYECKSLTYIQNDRRCQISSSAATNTCTVPSAMTYVATTRSPSTTTTTTPQAPAAATPAASTAINLSQGM